MEHPGWEHLVEAIDEREKRETFNRLTAPPSEAAAEYADFIGFLKGLRELTPTAQRIVDYGRQVEQDIRNQEVAGSAA